MNNNAFHLQVLNDKVCLYNGMVGKVKHRGINSLIVPVEALSHLRKSDVEVIGIELDDMVYWLGVDQLWENMYVDWVGATDYGLIPVNLFHRSKGLEHFINGVHEVYQRLYNEATV